MFLKKATIASAIALTLANAAAGAADFGDIFSVRGFGTLGVIHSDEDKADFVRDTTLQPEGAGYSDSWSAAVDSKAGLQVDMKFTDRFSGVVQLVSEGTNNNSWSGNKNTRYYPSLEWANLSYKVTDNFTVRGGRIVLPFLMTNEYAKVGYANTWMRAPVEVYGQIPFTSSDGGDVTYKTKFGSVTNTVRAYYGTQAIRASLSTENTSWGLNETAEIGSLTLRAAFLKADFTSVAKFGLSPIFDGFAAGAQLAGAQAAANQALYLSELFSDDHVYKSKWYNVGASYDPGNWFAMGEVVRLEGDNELIGKKWMGYASGGVRIDKFTPYAIYAQTVMDKPGSSRIPTAGLSGPLAAAANALNTSLIDAVTARPSTDQKTISVGLRWDAIRNVALKAQFDHIMIDGGSIGLLINQQPGFKPGSDVNVIGVSADFVF